MSRRRARPERVDQGRARPPAAGVGGVLPQPLAARQGRPQHARRELHRRLLLEHPRQGRHRHLGDAGARLPAARGRPPALRAARLPARHLLLLVPLQPAAREVPVHARRAARPLARGARARTRTRSRPGRRSSTTRRSARRWQQRARQGRLPARVDWDDGAGDRSPPSNVHTVKTHGPDRIAGFSPIPAMSMLSYAAGARFLQLLGGVSLSLLRLVLRPAARLARDLGRADRRGRESADWYNAKMHRGHGRRTST